MKADFTRKTFNPAKNYSRVLMQQGRVQTDADWNEQFAALAHREQAEIVETLVDERLRRLRNRSRLSFEAPRVEDGRGALLRRHLPAVENEQR